MTEPTAEHLKAAQEWLDREIPGHASAATDGYVKSLAALLSSREQALRMAIDRIREHWPHIEVGIKGRTYDPGSPTCLRCTIEKEIADAGAV